ncbi:MAG TPA: hypothetical protein VH206_14365 [Xanthobacteraceae bacterium]|jgi:hypothetical protein|nr:hypothetical protein [Xanthobacteraceae bacterium]
MKRVEADKLLQWAVNDELPKGEHVMQDVARTIEKHTKPGTGRKLLTIQLDKLTGCYLDGAPHPDALTIVKVLQRFDRSVGIPNEEAARALLGHFAQLDGRAVSAALGVRPNIAALLLRCAILKRRPVLNLNHPQPRPEYVGGDRRRPAVWRRDSTGEEVRAFADHWRPKERAAFAGKPYCSLVWDNPMITTIAEQRAEHFIWSKAISLLQRHLVGRLIDHEALPLTAAADPWSRAPVAPPTIHKSALATRYREVASPNRGAVVHPPGHPPDFSTAAPNITAT